MTTYIITGAPGAGKSTLANQLAHALPRSAYLHCDDLYDMVRGGHVPPWEDKESFFRKLLYRNAHGIIRNFATEEFSTVVDYVFRIDFLREFLATLEGEVNLTVLLPKVEINVERDRGRRFEVGEERVRLIHHDFADEPLFRPYLLDTSELSVSDAVSHVLSQSMSPVKELRKLLSPV